MHTKKLAAWQGRAGWVEVSDPAETEARPLHQGRPLSPGELTWAVCPPFVEKSSPLLGEII